MIQASTPSRAAFLGGLRWRISDGSIGVGPRRATGVAERSGVVGAGVRGAHRDSSLNRLNTVRRANVAMMIVAITTTTPAAEARP